MIYGIGTDVVAIGRIRVALGRHGERFAARILSADELAEYRASRQPERLLAKRFAAKEAVVKALGLGIREGLGWTQIAIGHDGYGKPIVIYEGTALETVRALGIAQSLISIADEQDYAVAFAVVVRGE